MAKFSTLRHENFAASYRAPRQLWSPGGIARMARQYRWISPRRLILTFFFISPRTADRGLIIGNTGTRLITKDRRPGRSKFATRKSSTIVRISLDWTSTGNPPYLELIREPRSPSRNLIKWTGSVNHLPPRFGNFCLGNLNKIQRAHVYVCL